MDLERIKQNLRLRSGRTKKPRKVPKAVKETSNGTDRDATKQPNGHVETPSHPLKSHSSNPSLQEQKQDPPQQEAETDTTQDDSTKQPSPRSYRDSGTDAHANESTAADEVEPVNKDPVDPDSFDLLESVEPATDQTMAHPNASTDSLDWDLRPPASKPKPPSVEKLSELLFSAGHLDTLIHHPVLLARFTSFLMRYRPQDHPLLIRYLEASKAIAAVEYANAVASSAPSTDEIGDGATKAASIDKDFQQSCKTAFDALVGTTLQMYITYSLVKVVSECLTNEITGRSTPTMRNLVGGLSEVFCLTDPNQDDNPIVYASEEFYRLTGYGTEDVIGHNCRFLQGPKTEKLSPVRLKEGVQKGEEVYETLLNYRRDGRPFINILLIAPLHDNKGQVKYFLGAQVDVSGLVVGGRALDSFQRYLDKREIQKRRDDIEASKAENDDEDSRKKKNALKKLRELSELFDLEESATVQQHSRAASRERGDDDARSIDSVDRPKSSRRVIVNDEDSDEEDGGRTPGQSDWNLGQEGPTGLSGKLPGIYEKYMLIRPAPSLRILFVSPKLRKVGNFLQSPFLAHVAAPSSTLSGLMDSFKSETPVSAKINFIPERGERREGTKISSSVRHEDSKHGRACWISATPLLGGDDRVGVWMITFVEKAQAGRQSRSTAPVVETQATRPSKAARPNHIDIPARPVSSRKSTATKQSSVKPEDMPIKAKRLDQPDTMSHTDDSVDQKAAKDAPDHPSDSEAYEEVPTYHRALSPTPEPTSQHEESGESKEVDESDESDQFVVPKSSQSVSEIPNRVVIEADDSDVGEDEPEFEQNQAGPTTTTKHTDADVEESSSPSLPRPYSSNEIYHNHHSNRELYDDQQSLPESPSKIPPSAPSSAPDLSSSPGPEEEEEEEDDDEDEDLEEEEQQQQQQEEQDEEVEERPSYQQTGQPSHEQEEKIKGQSKKEEKEEEISASPPQLPILHKQEETREEIEEPEKQEEIPSSIRQPSLSHKQEEIEREIKQQDNEKETSLSSPVPPMSHEQEEVKEETEDSREHEEEQFSSSPPPSASHKQEESKEGVKQEQEDEAELSSPPQPSLSHGQERSNERSEEDDENNKEKDLLIPHEQVKSTEEFEREEEQEKEKQKEKEETSIPHGQGTTAVDPKPVSSSSSASSPSQTQSPKQSHGRSTPDHAHSSSDDITASSPTLHQQSLPTSPQVKDTFSTSSPDFDPNTESTATIVPARSSSNTHTHTQTQTQMQTHTNTISGLKYMDYLRHPGSGTGTTSRTASGKVTAINTQTTAGNSGTTSKQTRRERRGRKVLREGYGGDDNNNNDDGENDDNTRERDHDEDGDGYIRGYRGHSLGAGSEALTDDVDCAMSPYSVD